MKYFAKIKYLGTNFHGFQVQPGERTVQGELCSALALATGHPCKVTGCSRTDAGVHANEFCISVECEESTIPADKLPVAVARFMPDDLSLFCAEEAAEEFHPRYDVVSKEYLYKIKNERVYDPFYFGRVWFLPKPIDDDHIQKMQSAADLIVGKKDFSAFMSPGSDVTDTVRNVFYVKVEKCCSDIDIKICADGFLYNMVRIIVGTLIEVAYDRMKPEEITKVIESRDRRNAGMTAPPEGLYLNKVSY